MSSNPIHFLSRHPDFARYFAAMLFIGFFAFFVGKISADTIMQQAMPDDFRGRAFALFDIAYNLGYIVPATFLPAMARQIVPDPALFALGFGPLVNLIRDHILGFVELDGPLGEKTIHACWDAVRM